MPKGKILFKQISLNYLNNNTKNLFILLYNLRIYIIKNQLKKQISPTAKIKIVGENI